MSNDSSWGKGPEGAFFLVSSVVIGASGLVLLGLALRDSDVLRTILFSLQSVCGAVLMSRTLRSRRARAD